MKNNPDPRLFKSEKEARQFVRDHVEPTSEIKIGLLGEGQGFRKCKYGDEKPYDMCIRMCGPGQQCNVMLADVKIRHMPIDRYLKQVDPKIKKSVLELIYKMELASGMIAEKMELVASEFDSQVSIISLTLNPHLRELGGDHEKTS